jgi:two-component system nitrate/nitrite sensor histidine kinase NarX
VDYLNRTSQKISGLRWLPWVVLGVTLVALSLHEVIAPSWLKGLSIWLQALFLGGVVLFFILVYLAGASLWHLYDQRRVLQKKLRNVETQASEAERRLEAVLQLSHKFLDASNEGEVVELLLSLSVDLVGAMGASLVPLDERGQPMTAVNHGDLPAPAFSAWVEYLASPAVRHECGTCQDQGVLMKSCPLAQVPFQDTMGLYCLPLRRGEKEFGVLNLYLPVDHHLTPKSQTFLKAMLDETALVLDSMRLRRRELDALTQLQSVRLRTDMKVLVSDFLENVRDTLKADFALLLLETKEENQLPLVHTLGEIPGHAQSFVDSVLQGVLASKEGMLIGDVSNDPESPDGVSSLLAVPLLPQTGSPLGGILVGNLRQKNFARRHMLLLRTLAGQIALVIQNLNLMAELEYQAMMAERTRLAREIHDGLAQTLGFLKLQTAQMKNVLTQGDMERLQQSLDLSYETLSEAYLDARQAIDSLRIHPDGEGMAGWLQQTVLEFQENSDLNVEISFEDRINDLPSEVQAQLIRILQESLNNVRKHAQASQAWVVCYTNGADMYLEVRDDGVGFRPEDVHGSSRYGLRGMRERAELIGAEFQVISCPKEGTTVSVRLPMVLGETMG